MTTPQEARATATRLRENNRDLLRHVAADMVDELAALLERQAQPVGHLYQHCETGRTRVVMPDQITDADAAWQVVGPLFLGAAPPAPQPRWTPVAERMPASGQVVLAAYRNSHGLWRRIRAQWVAAKSVEASCDSEIGEYDEATDTYYDPEGWYERINNWGEYSAVMVNEGEVSHWMALPPHPEDPKGEQP